jgi:Universal stress protein UspA and related nucleotide-binding proteins
MLGRIAIHLSSDSACGRRIDAGLQLAKHHNAAVVGVFPIDMPGHYYDESIVPHDVRQIVRGRRSELQDSIRKQFLEKSEAQGVSAEWRAPQGAADEALALHARYCDLLVMSKAEHTDTVASIVPNLAEAVVMGAGRPVLMIPNAGPLPSTIGERVLYCWDQRREAARAFTDAAVFMQNCKELVVLEVDRDEEQFNAFDVREHDFSKYCVSHGYPSPKHLVKQSEGIGVGNVILNTAADYGSDLIVMGAYGHSRMRQWVMGGASRTLLSSMTVPVLLAH